MRQTPDAERSFNQLQTPCLVIDAAKMKANIALMAQAVAELGVNLRPHAKTHKIPEFARNQIADGASGITVAKISEAEVMAVHGIDDILTVGVDSETGAQRLEELAFRFNRTLRVRLEVDIGLKRTGVDYGEHGMIRIDNRDTLKIGDLIHVIPNHICSTLNLHNRVYLLENGSYREIEVAARGMLE